MTKEKEGFYLNQRARAFRTAESITNFSRATLRSSHNRRLVNARDPSWIIKQRGRVDKSIPLCELSATPRWISSMVMAVPRYEVYSKCIDRSAVL